MGALRILIVEDNAEKLAAIVRSLTEIEGVELKDITDARDAISAKRLLSSHKYDLLLLDLLIPTRIDQEATRNAGVDLLREISVRANYIRPHHIIGITAHSEIQEFARPEFIEQLWALLQYDQTSNSWRRQLLNKVKYLLESKQSLKFSDGVTFETDLAIITALDGVEFQAIRNLNAGWSNVKIPFDPTDYIRGEFKNNSKKLSVVAASAPRMGMSSAAVTATKLIYNFRPKYLCMCGITAGVRGKVNIGDVLVPDPSWDWGSGKIEVKKKDSRFSPAPHQIPLNIELRTLLRRYSSDEQFLALVRSQWTGSKPDTAIRLHVEPVASGAAVLADPNVIDSVKDQQRKLVGIEMEAYGVMTAGENCSAPKPITFAAKSVCDFGDEEKSDLHQAYAAFISAHFIYNFALLEF